MPPAGSATPGPGDVIWGSRFQGPASGRGCGGLRYTWEPSGAVLLRWGVLGCYGQPEGTCQSYGSTYFVIFLLGLVNKDSSLECYTFFMSSSIVLHTGSSSHCHRGSSLGKPQLCFGASGQRELVWGPGCWQRPPVESCSGRARGEEAARERVGLKWALWTCWPKLAHFVFPEVVSILKSKFQKPFTGDFSKTHFLWERYF